MGDGLAESSRQTEWVLQILRQQKKPTTHTSHSSCVSPPQPQYPKSCPNDTVLDTESTLLTLMTLLTSLIQLLWGKLLPAIPPLDAEGPYRKKTMDLE